MNSCLLVDDDVTRQYLLVAHLIGFNMNGRFNWYSSICFKNRCNFLNLQYRKTLNRKIETMPMFSFSYEPMIVLAACGERSGRSMYKDVRPSVRLLVRPSICLVGDWCQNGCR